MSVRLRAIISVIFLSACVTTFTHAQESDGDVSNDDADKAYQSCSDSWIDGLTKNNPDMAQIDIKYVAAYYCLCGFEFADKNASVPQRDPATFQAQTFKVCMPYAVLRNTLHYDIETPVGHEAPPSDVLQTACKNSFPGYKDNPDLVDQFCQCAAKPITDVRAEKNNLSESELKARVQQIARDCAK